MSWWLLRTLNLSALEVKLATTAAFVADLGKDVRGRYMARVAKDASDSLADVAMKLAAEGDLLVREALAIKAERVPRDRLVVHVFVAPMPPPAQRTPWLKWWLVGDGAFSCLRLVRWLPPRSCAQ